MFLQPGKSNVLFKTSNGNEWDNRKEGDGELKCGCLGGPAPRYRDHKLRNKLGVYHLIT